jgi:hypothetical protein
MLESGNTFKIEISAKQLTPNCVRDDMGNPRFENTICIQFNDLALLTSFLYLSYMKPLESRALRPIIVIKFFILIKIQIESIILQTFKTDFHSIFSIHSKISKLALFRKFEYLAKINHKVNYFMASGNAKNSHLKAKNGHSKAKNGHYKAKN